MTSHGDHFHYYNGKVPSDAIFSEELMKDANYQLKDADINEIKGGYIIMLDRHIPTLKMRLMIIFVMKGGNCYKTRLILSTQSTSNSAVALANFKVAIQLMMATS